MQLGNALATRIRIFPYKPVQTDATERDGLLCCLGLYLPMLVSVNRCKVPGSHFHGGNTGSNPVRVTTLISTVHGLRRQATFGGLPVHRRAFFAPTESVRSWLDDVSSQV